MSYMGLRKQSAMMDQEVDAPQMYVPQVQAAPVEQAPTMDAGQIASAGASGAAMGGPAGAAIGAGGAFLTQYIAQRAADERAKRAAIGQAYQNQAQNEF